MYIGHGRLKNILNSINLIYNFHTFCPSFLFFSFFLQLDLLAAATTSKVAMVHASPPSRCRLAGGGAPRRSPAVLPDCRRSRQNRKPDNLVSVVSRRGFRSLFVSPLCQTIPSSFYSFEEGLPVSICFVWQQLSLRNFVSSNGCSVPNSFTSFIDAQNSVTSKPLLRSDCISNQWKAGRVLQHFGIQHMGRIPSEQP
jgi:hypothetical protein